ncbi:hypothetical protein QFZ97_002218 [Paraburkholderia youngii]
MTEQPVFPCGQNDLAASSRYALTRHRFTIASMVDRYGKPLCSNPLKHLTGEVAHCRLRGVFAKQRGVVGRESAINECLEPKVRSAIFNTIGLALHETLLICGCCGRALTVRYKGNGGLYPLCGPTRRMGPVLNSESGCAGGENRCEPRPLSRLNVFFLDRPSAVATIAQRVNWRVALPTSKRER